MPGGRVAMRGHDGRCYQYNESGSMRICCTTCMSSPTWKRVYSWWDVRGSNSNLPEWLRGRNIAWELNSRTLRHKIRKPVQTYTRHNMCRKLSVAGLSGVSWPALRSVCAAVLRRLYPLSWHCLGR